jgi:hypothetical protein
MSHEEISFGFWPGSGTVAEPAFYAYVRPEPRELASVPVRPAAAYYSRELNDFILPYEAVRSLPSPDEVVLDFFQDAYDAGADLARWDRGSARPAARRMALGRCGRRARVRSDEDREGERPPCPRGRATTSARSGAAEEGARASVREDDTLGQRVTILVPASTTSTSGHEGGRTGTASLLAADSAITDLPS